MEKAKYNVNKKKRTLDGNAKKIFVVWSVYRNNVNVEIFSLKMVSSFSAQYFYLF